MKKLVIFITLLFIFISLFLPLILSGFHFNINSEKFSWTYPLGNIDQLIKIYTIVIQIWLAVIAVFSVLATLLPKIDTERQKHYVNINNNVFTKLKNLTISPRDHNFPNFHCTIHFPDDTYLYNYAVSHLKKDNPQIDLNSKKNETSDLIKNNNEKSQRLSEKKDSVIKLTSKNIGIQVV